MVTQLFPLEPVPMLRNCFKEEISVKKLVKKTNVHYLLEVSNLMQISQSFHSTRLKD